MSANDGGPTLRFTDTRRDGSGWTYEAMSLRDHFAGQALIGLRASGDPGMGGSVGSPDDDLARRAYAQADAMLKAREVQP